MTLLIYSHYFAPSIGGVETVVESLARGVAERRGTSGNPEFSVTLVTQTPAGSFRDEDLPFRVVRRPSTLALLGFLLATQLRSQQGLAQRLSIERESDLGQILTQLTGTKPQDFNRAGEGIRQHIEAYEAVRVELDRLDPAGAARRRSESTSLIDKLKQGFAAQFGTTPPGQQK